MITKIKLFFKKFWLKVVAVVAIPSAFAAGQLTGGTTLQGDTLTELTNRGVDARIQVLVKKPNFQDAIYYTPEVVTDKLTKKSYDELTLEIQAEEEKRFTDWKAFVAEESQKVAPIEEVTPIEEPIKEEVIEPWSNPPLFNEELNAMPVDEPTK